MKMPIVDFVKSYANSNSVRLHMPGHKGIGFFGVEAFDITEVKGADVLNEAKGIIGESEKNAATLFNAHKTFYSTEGSSQVIKTMLALINANKKGDRCRILAARNVHKSFVYGAALCDIDVEWLYSSDDHLCSCKITPEQLKLHLQKDEKSFDAVYVTSPDYLGNLQDIKGLSAVCDEYNIPLLVDNAHGAYLGFLEESLHPIILGASMCADSAHKTLPVLTGGAYLHIAEKYDINEQTVRDMMSVFGSTSPSYLVLQSLDACNDYLETNYREELKSTVKQLKELKSFLKECGFEIYGDEDLKLTVDCAEFGFSGEEVAEILRENGIEIEFCDDRFAVMMFSPQNSIDEIEKLKKVMCSLTRKAPITLKRFETQMHQQKMSIRSALFACQETVTVDNAVGKICAIPTVSCPPAVPVVISGEVITEKTVEILKHYRFTHINVVKEKA